MNHLSFHYPQTFKRETERSGKLGFPDSHIWAAGNDEIPTVKNMQFPLVPTSQKRRPTPYHYFIFIIFVPQKEKKCTWLSSERKDTMWHEICQLEVAFWNNKQQLFHRFVLICYNGNQILLLTTDKLLEDAETHNKNEILIGTTGKIPTCYKYTNCEKAFTRQSKTLYYFTIFIKSRPR